MGETEFVDNASPSDMFFSDLANICAARWAGLALVKSNFSLPRESCGLVFVPGQFGFDADGEIDGDIEAQTRRCLENVQAILTERGLSLADVVEVVTWLADTNDFPAFHRTYSEILGTRRAVRSTIAGYPAVPGALVEIEAIAERPF